LLLSIDPVTILQPFVGADRVLTLDRRPDLEVDSVADGADVRCLGAARQADPLDEIRWKYEKLFT